MKKLLLPILILILGSLIWYSMSYLKDLNQSQSVVNDLKSIRDDVDEAVSETIHEAIEEETEIKTSPITIEENKEKEFIDKIENYVGWITIDNTKIDYPIVKGEDNEFYLNHNYDLSENVAGSIFMDRRNLGNQFDEHTIIYGHHMKNGTMFTGLNLYLEEEFYEDNQLIYYRDLFNNYTYEVISAYYVSANDYTLSFELNETVIDDFLERSFHNSDYVYSKTDRFLTLSTCNYTLDNGRMIVHAVLITE